jgi:hypothetical protein
MAAQLRFEPAGLAIRKKNCLAGSVSSGALRAPTGKPAVFPLDALPGNLGGPQVKPKPLGGQPRRSARLGSAAEPLRSTEQGSRARRRWQAHRGTLRFSPAASLSGTLLPRAGNRAIRRSSSCLDDMSRTYSLFVDRDQIRFERVSTPATIAIGVERSKPVVLAVSESANSLERQWHELLVAGTLQEVPKIVGLGEDPWWDSFARGQKVGRPSAGTGRTVLYLEPLRSVNWSPVAINPLVRYAAHQSIGSSFFSRRIELTVSTEFSDAEYGDIADAVRAHDGFHVQLPNDRPPERTSNMRAVTRLLGHAGWTLSIAANFAIVLPCLRSMGVVTLAFVGIGGFCLAILSKSMRAKLRYEPKRKTA